MSTDDEQLDSTHAGCQSAYEREKRRADFAEARLDALRGDYYALASKMDVVFGHETFEKLDDKTPAGAVRQILGWHKA